MSVFTSYSDTAIVDTTVGGGGGELAVWPYGPISGYYADRVIYISCPALPEAGYNQEYPHTSFELATDAEFSNIVDTVVINVPSGDSFVPGTAYHTNGEFINVDPYVVYYIRARAYKN